MPALKVVINEIFISFRDTPTPGDGYFGGKSRALMSAFKRLIWIGHDRKLPTEIYTSLVASLFSDPRTLVIGALGSITAALIIAWQTADLALNYSRPG